MSKNDNPNMERTNRIRKYLEQISPDQHIESVREQLESGTEEDYAGDQLEVMRTDQDYGKGWDTLDVVISNKNLDRITPEGLDSLEAIIHEVGRPAIDIINDSFETPTGIWREIGIGETKKKIEKTIPSIGRIDVPNDPNRSYAGTGFVVGKNLIMTNRHVAKIFAEGLGQKNLKFITGQTAEIDFKHEIPRRNLPDPTPFNVTRVLMIHPYWDMALLEVDGLPEAHPMLALSPTPPEEIIGQKVVVIGYPGRDGRNNMKVQNKIFNNIFGVKRLLTGKLTDHRDISSFGNSVNAVTHDSSTLGGNSGSAVINIDSGKVVALHFAGAYLVTNYAV
ncbi:trypsin-like peptidase domain-containing protein, partial [Candidatus Pacearchaeota archaeon]|nr:trypsin-like peptidase domain-containing protein [Candidatus Pacearchaeota archaeon]